MTNKELESRLIDFSVLMNYGEALGAESKKDFVHKLGVVLKELRESYNCLRILSGTGYLPIDPSGRKGV